MKVSLSLAPLELGRSILVFRSAQGSNEHGCFCESSQSFVKWPVVHHSVSLTWSYKGFRVQSLHVRVEFQVRNSRFGLAPDSILVQLLTCRSSDYQSLHSYEIWSQTCASTKYCDAKQRMTSSSWQDEPPDKTIYWGWIALINHSQSTRN